MELNKFPIDMLDYIAQFYCESDSFDNYYIKDRIKFNYLLVKLRQCNKALLKISNKFGSIKVVKMTLMLNYIRKAFILISPGVYYYSNMNMLSVWLEQNFMKISTLNAGLIRSNNLTDHIHFWFACFKADTIYFHEHQNNLLKKVQLGSMNDITNVGYVSLFIVINRLLFIDNVPDRKREQYFQIIYFIMATISENIISDELTYQLVILIKKMENASDELFNKLFILIFDTIYLRPSYLRLQYLDQIIKVIMSRKYNTINVEKIVHVIEQYFNPGMSKTVPRLLISYLKQHGKMGNQYIERVLCKC